MNHHWIKIPTEAGTNMIKKILLILMILTITCVITSRFWAIYKADMKEYDRANCAVYGKMADCVTPLPLNERLK